MALYSVVQCTNVCHQCVNVLGVNAISLQFVSDFR